MKNDSKLVNKYPNRDKYVTNFAIIDWFNDRYKMVVATGDAKRIARYQQITTTKLVIEEPTILEREENYFRSTIISREVGLAFPDPKITFPTFENFLAYIDPDKQLYDRDGVTKSLTLNDLNALASSTPIFPTENNYALTKIDGTEKYGLLVFSKSMLLDLDEIYDTLFNGFMFQEIIGYSLETTDAGYPTTGQTTIDGYVTGSITLKDTLFKEQTVTIDIFNIKLIKTVGAALDHVYSGNFTYNGAVTYSG